jgi:hypothetical protein
VLFIKEMDTEAEASSVVSWNIAHTKYPYTDGELIE